VIPIFIRLFPSNPISSLFSLPYHPYLTYFIVFIFLLILTQIIYHLSQLLIINNPLPIKITVINLSQNRQTKVIENPLFEHLFWLPPTNPLPLNDFLNLVAPIVMRVQNAKHYFSKFPTVIYTHNRVRVFVSSVHYRSSHILQVLSKHLCVFHNVLPIFYVKYPAVKTCQFFYHP
jgi:hypothetical protein